jgi:alpha-amylase
MGRSLRTWMTTHAQTLLAQRPPADFNGTLMQVFHWYTPDDGTHWNTLGDRAALLAEVGFTAVWLPPAYKGMGGISDVGYGAYDLFDLGEFDQKGTVRTKYGTKADYIAAVKTLRAAGMQVYADVVFNHKLGGDIEEEFNATPYDPGDRNRPLGPMRRIKSWTQFDFPGRAGQYSTMTWHWWHFDAVDYNSFDPDFRAVYLIEGKSFDSLVDLRLGNYDFLMGCDLDMEHPQVRGELIYWGEWLLNTVTVDGFRLDAIKHIQGDFFNEWLDRLNTHLNNPEGRSLFTVGEYWTEDLGALMWYIGNAGGRITVFDVPLHYNFHRASREGRSFDLRRILDNTLMQTLPLFAVTFVDNHDSQPLQSLESWVESWFKPLAYAMILLRREGYPCVFEADYWGAQYRDRGRDGQEYDIFLESHRAVIDQLLFARKTYAYGAQYDYFNDPDVIGWTRLGTPQHPGGMAVVLSNGPGGRLWMQVGQRHRMFYDLLGNVAEPVETNESGWGEFGCTGGSVSVWVKCPPTR